MAIYENGLRLHRWQLDERRRYTADLEALSERLRADLGLLAAAIALETKMLAAPSHPQESPVVVSRLKERQRKLEHSVAELERQIAAARTAVDVAENEIAVYELAAAHRKAVGAPTSPRFRRAHGPVQAAIVVRRFDT